ncbi:MAG: hypothetical protein SFW36_23225 [Leptolyngbyaceae cyanobacterium bins.59]|nr:hypothetical protein [Leptolyngbyaceae cyanobacterium bins.59]
MTSFVACIAGLTLLLRVQQTPQNEHEETEEMLLRMAFTYWMLYCVALTVQRLSPTEWESLLIGVRFTAVMSYLLTFSCVLTLPMLHLSASQRQTQ